jgi:integrative and conjugative element protein (TIGR02256 family)
MQLKVWLNKSAMQSAFAESDLAFPNETGGLLFGYRAANSEFVIERISGPGPQAVHNRRSFIPDYAHDTELALEVHAESQGNITYLGDWHSHPNTSRSYLSRKDRLAISSVLNSNESNLDTALTMVIAGFGDGDWNYRIWIAELVKTFLIFDRLAAIPAQLELFE